MKKITNIIILFIIAFLTFSFLNYNTSFAIDPDLAEQRRKEAEQQRQQEQQQQSSSKITLPGYEIDPDKYTPDVQMTNKVKNSTNTILGIITIIGAISSVVLIAMIGFNYMLGSAQEKAADQGKLLTFAVGVILLTAGTGIVKLIYSTVINW